MEISIQKHQIIFIWGWWAFNTHDEYIQFLMDWEYDPYARFPDWKKWIRDGLSDKFESITLDMPSKFNAVYEGWEIWFEKLFPYINEKNTVVVAHSLGGIFVAKYLSENKFPRHLAQVHLVAPVLDDEGLIGESVASFGFDTSLLPNLAKQSEEVHIWASKDDPVVPFSHSERYHQAIPDSQFHAFSDRGHFFGQSSFVELFLEIQKIV